MFHQYKWERYISILNNFQQWSKVNGQSTGKSDRMCCRQLFQIDPFLMVNILTSDLYRNQFLKATEDWVCDDYSIDIRYFASKDKDHFYLLEALIFVNPLPLPEDINFRVEINKFYAGQYQLSKQPKRKLLKILDDATQGGIKVHGHSLVLSQEQSHNYYSEMIHHDRWFYDLHLQIFGSQSPSPTSIDATSIDTALRRNELPFDGLADLAGWLGLTDPRFSNERPSIKIRVNPPVDLLVAQSNVAKDQLNLTLHAHPRFDVSRLGLAIRAVPGKDLKSRKQVGTEIQWKRARNGLRAGGAQIALEQADSVLTMLMIGDSTVRRQWYIDPEKARNNRLIAIQHFDKELKMVKQAVLEPTGSDKFEKGIAALLFLLGFTPVLHVETNAPDLVVTTPSGRLVIVECTTKISSFSEKLGKLVERKGSLSKALQASGHHSRVDAVLVCAQPKDQIATVTVELEAHQIIFLTRDDLEKAFEQLRFPSNPDEILDKAVAQQFSGHTTVGKQITSD